MSVLGDLHESMSFGGTYLRQMGDQEPVAEILEKFTKMAEDTTGSVAGEKKAKTPK